MRSRVLSALTAMLCVAASVARSQNPIQQGSAPAAGTLALNNVSAAARDAVLATFADLANWHFMAAYQHANQALAIDSTFGLARIIRENSRAEGASIANAEYQRAIRDMSTRPIPEITLGLAKIANAPTAARLYAAAAAMYPNDRYVATEYAQSLTGRERLDSLRSLAAKYPDYAGARTWYVYYATINYFTPYNAAVIDEATKMATEALRIAPNEAAPHAALAHVLIHSGRHADALPHVLQAIKLDPLHEYAHYLAGQVYFNDGKPNAVDRTRAAFDSSGITSPSLARQTTVRRDRAILLMHDGRVQQAESELLAIAGDAERRSAPGIAGQVYQDLAILSAAARDTAKVSRYIAESHRAFANVNREVEVDALALARMPVQARAALDVYLKGAPSPMPATTATVAKRLEATVAYAEGKYDAALADCTDVNPYCDLVKVESLIGLGRTKEAEAMRTAFLARKDLAAESRAVAVMRYRAGHAR